MNEEHPATEQPTEAPVVDAQRNEAQPLVPPLRDPGRRLRELLAIPDRDRTDAVWDEIIALEIQLAPGNRVSSPQANGGRQEDSGRRQEPGQRPQQARRQEQPAAGTKSSKRYFKRRKRSPGT